MKPQTRLQLRASNCTRMSHTNIGLERTTAIDLCTEGICKPHSQRSVTLSSSFRQPSPSQRPAIGDGADASRQAAYTHRLRRRGVRQENREHWRREPPRDGTLEAKIDVKTSSLAAFHGGLERHKVWHTKHAKARQNVTRASACGCAPALTQTVSFWSEERVPMRAKPLYALCAAFALCVTPL